MAEDGFRATNRIFEEDAMGGGDFAALARVYTEGARLFSPGVPAISGIAGIIDYWKGAAGALGVTGAKLHSLDLKVTGDRATEVGRGEIFTAPGKPPVTCKYVVLWKQEDGAWKWDVDIWNTNA